MVNAQLVEYIKQQTQGGVTKDAVKKALLDAGWPEADVNESLAAAVPATAPLETKSVAASLNPAMAMAGTASPEVKPSFSEKPQESVVVSEEHSHHGLVPMIVMGAVIVLLLGALGYVYFSLSGKLTSATTSGTTNTSQVAALENQIKSLGDEKASLTAQVASLTEANGKIADELSFFALPVSGSLTQDIEGKAKGTLSGGGTIPYAITTEHQLRVYVKNWKDAKVDAILKPLIGNSVEVSGTHKPTSPDLTVTAVNGAAVNPPVAATSTAPKATTTTP